MLDEGDVRSRAPGLREDGFARGMKAEHGEFSPRARHNAASGVLPRWVALSSPDRCDLCRHRYTFIIDGRSVDTAIRFIRRQRPGDRPIHGLMSKGSVSSLCLA